MLHCPYDFDKGRLIVREMTELLVLDLVRKRLVTKQIVLDIGYDRESLTGDRGKNYTGPVAMDHYGRKVPKHAHGTIRIDHYTSRAAEEKERKLQRVTLAIQDRFGKNAMLKGMNLMEGGTTIDRNGQIGGHKAGDE